MYNLPKPSKKFYDTQFDFYNDPIPHRHKFNKQIRSKTNELKSHNNINAPMYSVHKTLNDEEKRFTYVDSRFFYCCAYEILAKKKEDFKTLKTKLDQGYNLIICGYDAFSITKSIYDHYCDVDESFGHERVLYSLLIIDEKKDYPWWIYKKNNPKSYSDDIAHMIDLKEKK